MSNLNTSQTGPKKKISFIIREEHETLHRAAVSALQYDPKSGRLFTGGSDTIIRTWSVPLHKDAFSARGGVRPGKHSPVQYQSSLEQHTDWVNDMVLFGNGRLLMSASNDTTVKIWNIERDNKHRYVDCIRTHKDYVSCLAYASGVEKAISASFDNNIFAYDINANFKTVNNFTGCKDSIYSIATTPNMSIVLGGGTDKCIRVFDPRTNDKPIKLRGHTDNVRALLINDDGTRAISAGSDATIRLWDIGQQLSIDTCIAHEEGVWTLQVDSTFTNIYSAGKDKMVLKTPTSDFRKSQLLFHENAPVKKLLLSEREHPSSIWVGTWKSDINRWSIRPSEQLSIGFDEEGPSTSSAYAPSPPNTSPQSDKRPRMKEHPVQQTRPELVIKGLKIEYSTY
uniref:WD_REPEATS_REGION domain-containing protein n=1 Tax=Caenorhabditis tropicalis TaxID=1561998 RepID=A0A1I7T2C8_9PELO